MKRLPLIFFHIFIGIALATLIVARDTNAQAMKSSEPPKIDWAQGGLSGLYWGMSKHAAERTLGCKLKLYDSGSAGQTYKCNLATTWVNNLRISFTRHEIISPCSLHFLNNRLKDITFAANRGGENQFARHVLSAFGEGAPARDYYYGGDYIWFDDSTVMICSNSAYCSIYDWKATDRLIGDSRYKKSYNNYISWWQRKNN